MTYRCEYAMAGFLPGEAAVGGAAVGGAAVGGAAVGGAPRKQAVH